MVGKHPDGKCSYGKSETPLFHCLTLHYTTEKTEISPMKFPETLLVLDDHMYPAEGSRSPPQAEPCGRAAVHRSDRGGQSSDRAGVISAEEEEKEDEEEKEPTLKCCCLMC